MSKATLNAPKLNIGCGEFKIGGYINIDIEAACKPDLVHDIRTQPLPYASNTIEEINCIHNIEHIEYKFHPIILDEFWRVLKPEGKLTLAYPEFSKCAVNFISDYKGMKAFWRATLYGRQLHPGDYHVTPMDTLELVEMLKEIGYKNIRHIPETDQPFNTFLQCLKGEKPLTREDILRKEIFE
jgi:predicted SAM-dependent methyltransferase